MKFPSEVQLEAVYSEVESHTVGAHKGGTDDCDFCQLCKELDNRNGGGGDFLCAIDSIPRAVVSNDPMAMLLISSPFGGAMVVSLITVSRLAFLIGLKAGRGQVEMESPEEKLGEYK